LEMAKAIYARSLEEQEALRAPYAAVIDIDAARLPSQATVDNWTSEQFVMALRHDASHSQFNPHMRQLVHVGYKVAAQMGHEYLEMLEQCEASIARNVCDNVFERHLKPLFLD